jgi:multimeric flavodoxin WrbA
MKILAINGSPHRHGRISKIVNEILKGAAEKGSEVEILHLAELKLWDCMGCMACQKKGACLIRDDIQKIEEGIRGSDIIIWASPTRWGNVSGLMLKVFERLFGFLIEEKPQGLPGKRSANGKKAILVTACSTPSPFNWLFNQSRSCFRRMREITKYSGQKIIGTFVLSGTFQMGDIPESRLRKARELGYRLV